MSDKKKKKINLRASSSKAEVLRTWLGSCIEVLLQERHRVDLLGISGRVEKFHGCKLS